MDCAALKVDISSLIQLQEKLWKEVRRLKVTLAPERKQMHANSKVLTLPGGLGTHVAVPLPAPFSAGHHPPESHLPVHGPWVPPLHL